jgi:hypothetical protein
MDTRIEIDIKTGEKKVIPLTTKEQEELDTLRNEWKQKESEIIYDNLLKEEMNLLLKNQAIDNLKIKGVLDSTGKLKLGVAEV